MKLNQNSDNKEELYDHLWIEQIIQMIEELGEVAEEKQLKLRETLDDNRKELIR